MDVVISSGHGKYVRGASGYIDEVDEARKVVEMVAQHLRKLGVGVTTFHDDVSTTQDDNLARIVDFQLVHLAARLHERDLGLEVTEAARAYLARVGYDPDFGARPLKRVLQREVADPH